MATIESRRRASALGGLVLGLLVLATACATPPPVAPERVQGSDARASVVRAATGQLGVPYRFGGSSPRGFDCSGLVIYSYEQAGLQGLPHSAAALQRMSAPVPMESVRPGDLLFFQLGDHKPNHVGIYLGDREFIHAPSRGKVVEKVSFDHVYWREELGVAGRLLP